MILNILLVISKCIKPFFKKQLVNQFSIIEDMILYNFIFFLFSLIYYTIIEKNNIYNIYNKINNDNCYLIIKFLILTLFELIVSNYIIQNNDITVVKNIHKGLYVTLTPIIGYYLFNTDITINTIFGSLFILIGIYIINR